MSNNSFVIATFPLNLFLRLTAESSVDVDDSDVEIGSFSLGSRTKKHELKIRYVSRTEEQVNIHFYFCHGFPLHLARRGEGTGTWGQCLESRIELICLLMLSLLEAKPNGIEVTQLYNQWCFGPTDRL